jgi:hypothetical protein
VSRKRNEPGSSPPAELLRLAEEGARNIQRADRGRAAEADRHLRVALGAHYGSLLRRLAILPLLVGIAGIVGGSTQMLPPEVFLPGAIFFAPLGMFGFFFLDPKASRGRVEKERAWLTSRGFPVSGYFEALSQTPTSSARLIVQVRFTGEVPPLDLVQGVLGRIDAAGTVQPAGGGALVLRSGGISGVTGIRVNKVPVYRNHRIVPYVHRLVDEVLAPLHATYPLADVAITRPV